MLRVRGPMALFTRPELKVERMSYPAMTPSAARGVLEAVLWKPAIRWRIERIKVLAPIKWTSFKRNEVASRAATPAAALVSAGGQYADYFADEDRSQRNTVALKDVDYIIEARIDLTPRAGPEDNKAKFIEMFRRRLEKGQVFNQPYLGTRECAAEVLPVDGTEIPIPDSRDFGLMLWDLDYRQDKQGRGLGATRAHFFHAVMTNGVIEVPAAPPTPEQLAEGIR
jgi:CRISPR-associated protein Cas5d